MGAVSDALAAIMGQMTTAKLGESVTLDGAAVVVVRSAVTAEEMADMGMDGLNTEAIALHVKAADLTAVPVPGQRVTLDGKSYDVGRVVQTGGVVVRLLLTRYAG